MTNSDPTQDDAIDQLDLTREMQKLHKDYDWPSSDCEAVCSEYRRFLKLKKLYPDVEIVPSKYVDIFWHAHILNTKKYNRDCNLIFGDFLHHNPFHGAERSEEWKDAIWQQTLSLYDKEFGSLESVAMIWREPTPCGPPTEDSE